MRTFIFILLMSFAVFSSACDSEKSSDIEKSPTLTEKVNIETTVLNVTREEAQAKLVELSAGLTVDYDDMKERTYYRAVSTDNRVIVMPYVLMDRDYNVVLIEHLQYIADHLISFRTLYIKSANQVKHFEYHNVKRISFDSEAYAGLMNSEVRETLKAAINSGYVRVRLEGENGYEEKELSNEEMNSIRQVFEVYEYFKNIKVVD